MASTRKTSRGNSRGRDESIVGRTGRTIKERPYTSAAIATGAVTAVAAAVAGAFFFRRSDKSLGEIGDDLSEKISRGARSIKDKAGFMLSGDGDDSTQQSEIAEEAETLKATGRKSRRPVDPTIEKQLKTGAISY